MAFFSEPSLWRIEEIGDCTLVLSHTVISKSKDRYTILPNPDDGFIKKYGFNDYLSFAERFLEESKDAIYTPETLILSSIRIS